MPGDIATCCNSSMKYSSSGTDCTTLSNVNPVSKTELTPSADESETSIGCSRGQVKSGGGSITADDEIEHITDEPISDEDVAECSDDAEYDTDLEIKEGINCITKLFYHACTFSYCARSNSKTTQHLFLSKKDQCSHFFETYLR